MSAKSIDSAPSRPQAFHMVGAAPAIGPGSLSTAEWLARHGGRRQTASDILSGACEGLRRQGVPVTRVTCTLEEVHPQIEGIGLRWTQTEGVSEVVFGYQEGPGTEDYLHSPIKVIDDGADAIRRPLHRNDCALDFPVLAELRNEGATDYLATALVFSDGTRNFISWVTHEPGGFSSDQLAEIDALSPLLALRLEIERSHTMTHTLLRTYLGNAAADRVIKGTIRRFQCEALNAIILYCDLRDFTAMADGLPPDDTIRALCLYYEAVAEPIQYFNGDIIKIIGDGLLAIFPVPKDAPPAQMDHVACGANAAVRRALAALEAIPSDVLPEGIDHLRAGFALHAGEIVFGNVGSQDRLDFTAIGTAVNEVVRVEALTKSLGFPVLTTSAFAGLECTVQLESVGFHHLRGVREPKELFRPLY
ncbi:MAG: adenylate/guanylate cyclase domain-containing protein [Alphaproteobacteria bacterium]